jgi:hypothetical protein
MQRAAWAALAVVVALLILMLTPLLARAVG